MAAIVLREHPVEALVRSLEEIPPSVITVMEVLQLLSSEHKPKAMSVVLDAAVEYVDRDLPSVRELVCLIKLPFEAATHFPQLQFHATLLELGSIFHAGEREVQGIMAAHQCIAALATSQQRSLQQKQHAVMEVQGDMHQQQQQQQQPPLQPCSDPISHSLLLSFFINLGHLAGKTVEASERYVGLAQQLSQMLQASGDPATAHPIERAAVESLYKALAEREKRVDGVWKALCLLQGQVKAEVCSLQEAVRFLEEEAAAAAERLAEHEKELAASRQRCRLSSGRCPSGGSMRVVMGVVVTVLVSSIAWWLSGRLAGRQAAAS